VLVLQQCEQNKWGFEICYFLRYFLYEHSHPHTRLLKSQVNAPKRSYDVYLEPAPFLLCSSTYATFGPLKIFELEYASVISREIFVGIPRTGPERSHSAVSLEPDTGGNFLGCINLIWECQIVFFLPFTSTPRLESASQA
jgi:hypothetical protein